MGSLPSAHSLQLLDGLAPGAHTLPPRTRLPCRVCASCGAPTPAWELVWGACEEKELLRGGLEEGPLGWALRQRQGVGAWTGHGGAGVGRRGCWTRLLGRESVGAVEEDMGQEWKEGPAVQLLQNPA